MLGEIDIVGITQIGEVRFATIRTVGNARLSGGNIMARWDRSQGEGKDFLIQAYYTCVRFDRARRRTKAYAEDHKAHAGERATRHLF